MKSLIYLLPILFVSTAFAQDTTKPTKEDLILMKLMDLQKSIDGINKDLRQELNNAVKEIKEIRAELDVLKAERKHPKPKLEIVKSEPKITETRTTPAPEEKSKFIPTETKPVYRPVYNPPVVYYCPPPQHYVYYHYPQYYYYPCHR